MFFIRVIFFIIFLNNFVISINGDDQCMFLDFNDHKPLNSQLESCPFGEEVFVKKSYDDVAFNSLREDVKYFLFAPYYQSRYVCGIMPTVHWTPESYIRIPIYIDLQNQEAQGFVLFDWIDLDADISDEIPSSGFLISGLQSGWNIIDLYYKEEIRNCKIKLQIKVTSEIVGIEYIHIFNTEEGKESFCDRIEGTTPEVTTTPEETTTEKTTTEGTTTTERTTTTEQTTTEGTTTAEITTTPEVTTTTEQTTVVIPNCSEIIFLNCMMQCMATHHFD